MRRLKLLLVLLIACSTLFADAAPKQAPAAPSTATLEQRFLAVPDPRRAEEYMRVLTSAPHVAGTPEDKKTADYVAGLFRQWGFDVEIAEYRVWMNYPAEVSVDITAPTGVAMHGPSKERVESDPYQDDPRVMPAFNGYSPSGDVEAEAVYVNYCRPDDFNKLKELGVEPRGKILLCRYGENFRGVKTYMAQEVGAAGLIIYSDPMDDGYFRGDVYPNGPWRPPTAVQRGTVEYGFAHAGDPTTPGYASTPDLPDSKRVAPQDSPDMPKVPTLPLSYKDAAPIMEHIDGPATPREWQGALPFTYHVGPGPVRVKMHVKQDYAYRTIWDVIARVRGTRWPDELVLAGNHRDAWVFGAVDPVSGTVAMLEAARGIGALLRSGWRPKRTILFASWDAEEQGLVGSTEWLEQHENEMSRAVAYFNSDTGAAGPNFRASAVPSLRAFLREVTKAVPSPKGGTLYDVWRSSGRRAATPGTREDPQVGELGSGSDFTAFFDHSGVPATDIRSSGNYGVYHSVFDNFAWFKKFGDTDFSYSQEIARVFGLQVLRMSESDILPYDYEEYGREVTGYLQAAQKRAADALHDKAPNFDAALAAAARFTKSGAEAKRVPPPATAADLARLNHALRDTETALLLPNGLPRRPWFKHAIYAPADLKGYAASVIPGVNEAIQRGDAALANEQLQALTAALNRAAQTLESATGE